MDIYVITKRIEHGDIEERFIIAVFKTYKNAIKYINSMPDNHKYNISYDVDEIRLED